MPKAAVLMKTLAVGAQLWHKRTMEPELDLKQASRETLLAVIAEQQDTVAQMGKRVEGLEARLSGGGPEARMPGHKPAAKRKKPAEQEKKPRKKHRLGFVLKRPKKHLLKAKYEERKAFVLQYRQIRKEAQKSGAKIFFVDEAHFRADADLRGKWVLKGEAALVDSTSPRWGEKACYYSGVCLETGEVEAMEIAGNSNAETSTAFLQQLRENHPGPLVVIWDNGPAHRGEAIRSYLATPDLHLRLVALPAYSPDFNADEAVWDWAREEVTANECLGTKAQVQEKMNQFFGGLIHRKDEVKHRCPTRLQARADALIFTPAVPLPSLPNVVPTLALV